MNKVQEKMEEDLIWICELEKHLDGDQKNYLKVYR